MSDAVPFDVRDHYWFVAGDRSQAWSSRDGRYVAPADKRFSEWRSAGGAPTRIASAFELDQVLRQYGLSMNKTFTPNEALDALAAIDAEKVKAALGRDDLSASALTAGDAEKLASAAFRVTSSQLDPSEIEPPRIDGAEARFTLKERLRELESRQAVTARRV